MSKETSRRQFLWKAAAGVAGVTIAEFLLPSAANAQEGENTPDSNAEVLVAVNNASIQRDTQILYFLNETRAKINMSPVMPTEDGNLHVIYPPPPEDPQA